MNSITRLRLHLHSFQNSCQHRLVIFHWTHGILWMNIALLSEDSCRGLGEGSQIYLTVETGLVAFSIMLEYKGLPWGRRMICKYQNSFPPQFPPTLGHNFQFSWPPTCNLEFSVLNLLIFNLMSFPSYLFDGDILLFYLLFCLTITISLYPQLILLIKHNYLSIVFYLLSWALLSHYIYLFDYKYDFHELFSLF